MKEKQGILTRAKKSAITANLLFTSELRYLLRIEDLRERAWKKGRNLRERNPNLSFQVSFLPDFRLNVDSPPPAVVGVGALILDEASPVSKFTFPWRIAPAISAKWKKNISPFIIRSTRKRTNSHVNNESSENFFSPWTKLKKRINLRISFLNSLCCWVGQWWRTLERQSIACLRNKSSPGRTYVK